ncbi:unnamed protein product, partial [Staurois parvus]
CARRHHRSPTHYAQPGQGHPSPTRGPVRLPGSLRPGAVHGRPGDLSEGRPTEPTAGLYHHPERQPRHPAPQELSGCRVLCGPVSTSIFVDNCRDCLFAFPCQQLRTHTTRDSRFYLHVTSRAIIEDCTNLRFSPFTWSYPEILEDYRLSGLDRSRNNWDQVDDFNWLAMGVKSPNWSVIPEEERVTTGSETSYCAVFTGGPQLHFTYIEINMP